MPYAVIVIIRYLRFGEKRGISRLPTQIGREVMVKAAFASWNDRIAPVFDVTRWIQLVETEAGQIVHQNQASMESDVPNKKAGRLAELEVGILVCGAISRHMQATIKSYGIEVIPFIAGNVQEVIQAWLTGRLAGSVDYAMPGCPKAVGRRIQGVRGVQRKIRQMPGGGRRKGEAGSMSATIPRGRKRKGR